MKKLLTILLASLTFSGFSQEITFPEKKQPIKFNKIAFKDTVFIDTASIYNVEGYRFEVATTADGRFFFKVVDPTDLDTIAGNLVVADTIKANNAQLTSLSGSGIYVSVDANGNLYKNNIEDSIATYVDSNTYWDNSNGYLVPKTSAMDSVFVGFNSYLSPKSENVALQLYGQYNNIPIDINPTTGDSILNAKPSNTYFVDGTGEIVQINKCAIGTRLLFSVVAGATLDLDPAKFGANGQVLRSPLGAAITLSEYDVIEVICIDVGQFAISSDVIDNQ